MSQNIVTVNVAITKAPAPSTLQETGAILSQGATTLTAGTYSLIEEPADLTPLLHAAAAITGVAWSGSVVTVTTTAPLPAHLATGTQFLTTISGMTPAGYNGQFLATVTGASAFTYALANNPGAGTVEGTYTFTDDLVAEVATFFAQGRSVSVYVLELGEGVVSAGVTALTTFIAGTPNFFYSYLVPRYWDGVSQFLAFLAGFESTTAKTYFFVTTTSGTYTDYTALMKCVVALVEAPTTVRPITEFSMAALFWKSLSYNPSGTNKVTKFAFAFVFGVTAYPTTGNAAFLASLKAAFVNVIGTAAEGGLTNTMVLWGTTMDGEDFTWWYAVDWAQINLDLNLSNAVINGSNNPINPLYYNQQGINVLQDVSVATFNTAVTDGMALGPTIRTTLTPDDFTSQFDQGAFTGEMVVNAIPFLPYTEENPSDYGIGKYAGLSGIFIPQNGFKQVIFNIDVTDIV